jgi:hypothetical protein
MFEPLTGEAFARANEELGKTLRELIGRLRSRPPRGGGRHKTIDDLCREQGVGPINLAELRALRPGALYEGFHEDLKRMRRGLPALGPRE